MQRILEPDRNECEFDGLAARFWGVRGSFSICGREYEKFGGNTPCVEIRMGRRLFIVDAGTGLAVLGRQISDHVPKNVDILLSHLHLDHIGGLLMCKHLLLDEKRTIRTFCGNLDGASAKAALDKLFSPPLFPITLDMVPANFEHRGFRAGEPLTFEDGIIIRTTPLDHPGGATGYRFDHDGRAICYLSDLEHSGVWPDPALVAFCEGADMVIFDGMFCMSDYCNHAGWGHSTWMKGVELCRAANVTSLAVFHHNPCYDDDRLEEMEHQLQQEMPTAFIARERHFVHFAGRNTVKTAGLPSSFNHAVA